MGIKKYLNAKNALATVAAPFTGGLSLALLNDGEGNDILGEITGKNSAKQANKQNIALQQETNAKSIELANTAHQREVADLKAAKLNPVLSVNGTGAATPTLGTATVEQTQPGGLMAQAAQAANVANLFSSAKQMATQAKLNKVNTEFAPEIAQSEIAKNTGDAAKALADAGVSQKTVDFYVKHGVFPGATTTVSTGTPWRGNSSETIPVGLKPENQGSQNSAKRTAESQRKERNKEQKWLNNELNKMHEKHDWWY